MNIFGFLEEQFYEFKGQAYHGLIAGLVIALSVVGYLVFIMSLGVNWFPDSVLPVHGADLNIALMWFFIWVWLFSWATIELIANLFAGGRKLLVVIVAVLISLLAPVTIEDIASELIWKPEARFNISQVTASSEYIENAYERYPDDEPLMVAIARNPNTSSALIEQLVVRGPRNICEMAKMHPKYHMRDNLHEACDKKLKLNSDGTLVSIRWGDFSSRRYYLVFITYFLGVILCAFLYQRGVLRKYANRPYLHPDLIALVGCIVVGVGYMVHDFFVSELLLIMPFFFMTRGLLILMGAFLIYILIRSFAACVFAIFNSEKYWFMKLSCFALIFLSITFMFFLGAQSAEYANKFGTLGAQPKATDIGKDAVTDEIIAQNPNTSPELLDKLYELRKTNKMSILLSANPATPSGVLSKLALSQDIEVMSNILCNPNVTCDVVEHMSKDARSALRSIAAQRLACVNERCLCTNGYVKIKNICTK